MFPTPTDDEVDIRPVCVPLEAILVIFRRSSLNFYESSWKSLKNDTTFVRMRSGHHLGELIKKVNSTERGALFRHFCLSNGTTTAHAYKSGEIFVLFQDLSNKIIKAPEMNRWKARHGCLSHGPGNSKESTQA